MKLYLLVLFTAFTFYSPNKQIKRETSLHVTILINKIKTSDDEELVLKTFVYDSCQIKNSSTFLNGIKKQELIFLKDGKQICKESSPMGKKYVSADCRDSLQVLENVIYEISVIEGIHRNLYVIKGSGVCNACPELFAFYNTLGECVWLNYSNKYKVFKAVGSFKDACKEFGIDSSIWYGNKYKKVKINL